MVATLNGTAGNDTLTGSTGDDQINGGAGNDRILASTGNDLVDGGDGSDLIYGEAGNDTLHGGAGNDQFYGGGGDDVILGQDGDDGLVGDGGNDILNGGLGSDVLWGGSGNDRLIHVVGEGQDQMLGHAGTDTLEIHMTAADVTAAVRADLATLKAYMQGQLDAAGSQTALAVQSQGAAVTLSALGVTMQTIEVVKFFVDGQEVALDSLLNAAPTVASEVTLAVTEGQVLTGTVEASDADGDALAFSVAQGPANGTVAIDAATGTYTFTPAAHWAGEDNFRISVRDSFGNVVQQDVRVAVDARADAANLAVAGASIAAEAGKTLFAPKPGGHLAGGSGSDVITGGRGNDVLVGNGGGKTTVALDIGAKLTDTDGSETLSIRITGVPDDAELSAGSRNDDGSWSLAPSDLAGLSMSGVLTDDVTLRIEATTEEANGSRATVTADLVVDVDVRGDTINGRDGDDRIVGSAGNDTLLGGKGNDVIEGGAGNDTLNGNSGNDVLADGAGNDKVYGSSGNDTVLAGEGDDYYSGGSGFDTLDFSGASQGMAIDVSKSTAVGMGTDTFTSFEKIVGSSHDDTFKGSSRADNLDGGAGDDLMRGLGGADVLSGGEGNDTFQWFAKDVMSGKTHLGVDTITDFSTGDMLDLRDILKKFDADERHDHVRVTEGKLGSMVSVDMGGKFVDVVMLQGVYDTSAADLLASGAILA
jgi:Ca2+-binding RTX toxin-like protein